jgi:hypothetical protein
MLRESKKVRQFADLAVIAFVKIVAGIRLAKSLKKYS